MKTRILVLTMQNDNALVTIEDCHEFVQLKIFDPVLGDQTIRASGAVRLLRDALNKFLPD
jgi:hypothetical protein